MGLCVVTWNNKGSSDWAVGRMMASNFPVLNKVHRRSLHVLLFSPHLSAAGRDESIKRSQIIGRILS